MRVYVVDAFANEPFKGNPAAFDLRWFTPKVEVDLCGHATLASAHVLWETGIVAGRRTIIFCTRSGALAARPAAPWAEGCSESMNGTAGIAEAGNSAAGTAAGKRGNAGADREGWIELDFPAEPPESVRPPEGLIEALGVEPLYVGRTRFDFLVETASEDSVRRMRPDFAALEKVPCRGIIVTAEGTDCDFVSRFFAPAVGIREDPVTGSAHCSLAPYWNARLGKSSFDARQVSERGGALRVRTAGGRTYIAGRAVTVLEGTLVRVGG